MLTRARAGTHTLGHIVSTHRRSETRQHAHMYTPLSACDPGSYSEAGASDCTSCPDLQYQDLPAQSSCKPVCVVCVYVLCDVPFSGCAYVRLSMRERVCFCAATARMHDNCGLRHCLFGMWACVFACCYLCACAMTQALHFVSDTRQIPR